MTREEAINMLYGIQADNLNLDDAYTKDKYDALAMAIKALEQEPKTGHWIAIENEEMKTVGYFCSECDLPMETEQWTDFCPNCGAKMEARII